jgi:hypothetical protein
MLPPSTEELAISDPPLTYGDSMVEQIGDVLHIVRKGGGWHAPAPVECSCLSPTFA